MGSLQDCEVTRHAWRKIGRLSATLIKHGLDPSLILYAVKKVCSDPETFDREEAVSGKRYVCFSLSDSFYLIIVFVKGSTVRIITVIITTKLRDVTKKCGRHHPLIAE
ncbi:MAG: hypothetical protein ACP5HQ_07675 [Thermoprotei archaeon]